MAICNHEMICLGLGPERWCRRCYVLECDLAPHEKRRGWYTGTWTDPSPPPDPQTEAALLAVVEAAIARYAARKEGVRQ